MPVNTPSANYTMMSSKWARCRACYEGSDAVKDAGSLYLPLLDSHRDPDGGAQKYAAYKMRALYYNAMARTVDGLAGGILQKAPVFEVPETIEPHLLDVTLSGVDAEGFVSRAVREVLTTGRYGVLVEMPVMTEGEAQVEDVRPYWCGLAAEDMVSWKVERRGGQHVLTRLVLREVLEVPEEKDEWATYLETCYRVLWLDEAGNYTQQLYKPKKKGSNEYVAADEPVVPMRRGEALTEIPFVLLAPTSTSMEPEKPPLLDMVDVNLSHYRTMADLEHGRHYTALPTPWIAGRIETKSGALYIGAGEAWQLAENGRAGMLEYTGAGLGALDKADEQKRMMMAVLGARLLEDSAGGVETATAIQMRHAGQHATLRSIAQSVERGMTDVLRWHFWWSGAVPDGPRQDLETWCELNKDFVSTRLSSADVQVLLQMLQAETISYETFYANLQSGEIARQGVTAEQEQAQIGRQGNQIVPPGPPQESQGEDDEGQGEDDDLDYKP